MPSTEIPAQSATAAGTASSRHATTRVPLTLPPLPYPKDALKPYLSGQTLDTHYEKHHRHYLEKLEKALSGSPLADQSLEGIVRLATGGIFNLAAQTWNHSFYWNSMTPRGGGPPRRGRVATAIDASFGSYEEFVLRFEQVAGGLFGSGWIWVFKPRDGERLELAALPNAENPLTDGGVPILCADLWEHAYYLDHRNESARYVQLFLQKLVHWSFAEQRLLEA